MLPDLGLSAGDRTARMSLNFQFVAILAVLDHFTCFLGHMHHQCTLSNCILGLYIFWSRLSDLVGGLLDYLISDFLQVR